MYDFFCQRHSGAARLAMGGQIINATIIVTPRQKFALEPPGGSTLKRWSRAKRRRSTEGHSWCASLASHGHR